MQVHIQNSLTLLHFTNKNDHPQIQIISGLSGLKWCLICSPVLRRGEIAGKCGSSNVLCKFGLFVKLGWSNRETFS